MSNQVGFVSITKKEKIGIASVIGIILIGVGAYFLYRYYKDKKPVPLNPLPSTIGSKQSINDGQIYDLGNPTQKIEKINKMVSGQCDDLDGCDRKVCHELFENGFYPRPMGKKNIPRDDILVPPTFSRHYDQVWQPPKVTNYWPNPDQQDEGNFYQGDFSESDSNYVNLDVDYSRMELARTQSPKYALQGMQGLHDFGDIIGYQQN